MKRPTGSNADEWALFLEEYEGGRSFIAVQIAEAIEAAERSAIERAAVAICDHCWAEFPLTEDGSHHDLKSVRDKTPWLEPCKAQAIRSLIT